MMIDSVIDRLVKRQLRSIMIQTGHNRSVFLAIA